MADSPAKPTRIPYLVGHACVSPLVFYITKTPLVRMRHKNSLSPYAINTFAVNEMQHALSKSKKRESKPSHHALPLP